ncbi:hypothetical protein ACFL1I_05870 [Candidatus Omnitrophota bacterium]
MEKPRLTPEEQLLKLIEQGDQTEAAKLKRQRSLFFKLNSLKIFFLSLNKNLVQVCQDLKSGTREPNLKALNKVLFVASIILLAYSVSEFMLNQPQIDRIAAASPAIKEQPEQPHGQKGQHGQERPFLHYLEMVRRRNAFSPIEFKQPEQEDVIGEKQLREMIKDLSLVGISWDLDSPIAMVEDKQNKKTYFLRQGELIDQFKIEQILKNRVILSFEGQTIELM